MVIIWEDDGRMSGWICNFTVAKAPAPSIRQHIV